MWVALPLVAGYIIYNIATFPEKLGGKVSQNVRKALAGQYEVVNQQVWEKVWASVVDGDELVEAIARDREFVGAMEELAREEKMA